MSESQNKPGVGVGVMILNDKGNVLLGKRHDDPVKADSELHGEGTWSLPGGKLDFGEGLEECARREVKEETDLDVKEIEPISIGNDKAHDKHFVTIGFFCTEFTGEPIVKEPDEITEWGWFPLEKLPGPMFPPALKVINNYKNKKFLDE